MPERLITINEAKEFLRLDNDYSDDIILPLINSLPSYLLTSTGLTFEEQLEEPLCKTVGTFLIKLWYNAEGTDSYRLQRVIDSLLGTLKFKKLELDSNKNES